MLTLACIVLDPWYRTVYIRDWRPLALFTLLIFVLRWPSEGAVFHGLEYEDAYVYSVVGRQLALGSAIPVPDEMSSYLTTVCSVGSLESCAETNTYSGHYIGLPYVISVVAKLFGFSPSIGAYVAVVSALLVGAVLWGIGAAMERGTVLASCVVGAFALIPTFSVHGIASYAEPLSNATATVAILLAIRLTQIQSSNRPVVTVTWLALTMTMLFAIVIKRENVILAGALPLAWALSSQLSPHKDGSRGRLYLMILTVVVVALFAVEQLRLLDSVRNETAEFLGFPFRWDVASSLLPLFGRALLSGRWYLYSGVLAIIGLGVALRRIDLRLWPFIVFVAYLATYSLHVRSFYMLFHDDVSALETLRYLTNVMSIWALMVGIGVASIVHYCSAIVPAHVSRPFAIAALGIGAAIALRTILLWRSELIRDERVARIGPAARALAVATHETADATYIVTPEPLVVQLFGPSDIRVAALQTIDSELLEELGRDPRRSRLVVLNHSIYRTPENISRFAEQYRALAGFKQEMLASDADIQLSEITLHGDPVAQP